MAKKHPKHVRHEARKHSEAHQSLKVKLKHYQPDEEKIGGIFVTTFIVVLFSILFFRHWTTLVEIYKSNQQPAQVVAEFSTNGFQDGVLGVYKVNQQATSSYRHLIASILTEGSAMAAENNSVFSGKRKPAPAEPNDRTLRDTLWVTNYLSKGQHLTKLQQEQAKSLQKSILSTYYLGEKTVDINNIIDLDSKILTNLNNTLSVDLFQYLNQATIRADALDEYLHLLQTLAQRSVERIQDLNSKISFLEANFASIETQIETSEEVFFQNLQMFNSEKANEELAKFVGVTESQVEVKAKIGAYTSLKEYYEFFLPLIENLDRAIRANREALIAGVKVTEIQNMSLPLIIRER